MIIFGSILTTFELSSIFESSWVSIENWLKPKTEPLLGNLACPDQWNALYVCNFTCIIISIGIFTRREKKTFSYIFFPNTFWSFLWDVFFSSRRHLWELFRIHNMSLTKNLQYVLTYIWKRRHIVLHRHYYFYL